MFYKHNKRSLQVVFLEFPPNSKSHIYIYTYTVYMSVFSVGRDISSFVVSGPTPFPVNFPRNLPSLGKTLPSRVSWTETCAASINLASSTKRPLNTSLEGHTPRRDFGFLSPRDVSQTCNPTKREKGKIIGSYMPPFLGKGDVSSQEGKIFTLEKIHGVWNLKKSPGLRKGKSSELNLHELGSSC